MAGMSRSLGRRGLEVADQPMQQAPTRDPAPHPSPAIRDPAPPPAAEQSGGIRRDAAPQDASQPPPAPPKRHWLLFAAGAVLVAVAGLALLTWDSPLARGRNPQTEDAYVDGDTTPLSARVQGYIRRLPIVDNQAVHAGDLIAQLDDDDYRAQSEQAQAQAGVAAAMLQSLDEREVALRLQVDQAVASLDAARAGLVSSGPEVVRQRILAPTAAGLGRNVDAANAEAQVTGAGVDRAGAQLDSMRRQLEVLAAQRRQAQATLGARQADARLAGITLDWTHIRAPVDGTLGARAVRVGTLVSPGTPVISITPLDSIWVTANFTERQVGDLQPGLPARLRVDAFPGQVLDGHVAGLSPGTGATFSGLPADNTTGNYTKVVQRVPVKIAIDWNGSPLRGLVRPGMSVSALVATDANAPAAPRSAR